MNKQLAYHDDKSNKFWNIETKGKAFTVTFGKIGTKGQSQTKEFESKEECGKEAEKLVNEKLKKGYKDNSAEISPTKTKSALVKNDDKEKKSDDSFFPFFGAGNAEYFEWAEIIARFISAPDKIQIDKIIKSAPEPIKPKKNDFSGRLLCTGSEQFVNMYVEAAYGDGELTDFKNIENDKEDYDYEDEYDDDYDNDPCFYVSEEAHDAFEKDIERWLNEIHSICPIEFAFRREDGEAGGTELSSWHEQSLKLIPVLIEKWNNDEYTFKQKEISNFTYALAGIFDYGDVKIENVPERMIETLFPEKRLEILLNKSDLKNAIEYIKEHQSNEAVNELIENKIRQFIDEEKYSMVGKLTKFVKDSKEIENAFISRASFYNNKSNFNKMLDVSLEGIKLFPDNQTIIANILFSADKAGKPEIVNEYINKKSEDPLVIANQSYSLATSGKVKEAYELLIKHFNNNGAFNVYSFNNLLYTCNNYQMPDDKTVEKIIEKAIKNLEEKDEYINNDFMQNLTILINNSKRYKKTLEVVKLYEKRGGDFPNAGMYCNYTNAAGLTNDKKIIKVVLDEIIAKYNKTPAFFTENKINSHTILGNIACLYALLNDKTDMLKFLELTKKYHPDFKKLQSDNDFKDYFNDPDFLKLFE